MPYNPWLAKSCPGHPGSAFCLGLKFMWLIKGEYGGAGLGRQSYDFRRMAESSGCLWAW